MSAARRRVRARVYRFVPARVSRTERAQAYARRLRVARIVREARAEGIDDFDVIMRRVLDRTYSARGIP